MNRWEWRAPKENKKMREESSSLPPSERTQGATDHRATPSRPPPDRPASVSSVRLKHETKTKHSVTQGHKIETPRNGHALNRYEASEGKS